MGAGPRPLSGQPRPDDARDQGPEILHSVPFPAPSPAGAFEHPAGPPRIGVALTRSGRGWAVVSPGGVEPVGDLIEGLSLADLVAEDYGAVPEPDRAARRSARGAPAAAIPDPVDARIAALERTVSQLEHALAARVATERAIGVLAERTCTSPREAFEILRGDARSSGRPVVEIAREVLATLPAPLSARDDTEAPPSVAAADGRR